MVTREILRTYTVEDLKKEIRKTNISNYHGLKKEELIDLMLDNKERFMHLKGKGKDIPPMIDTRVKMVKGVLKKAGKTPRQLWLEGPMAERLRKAFPKHKNTVAEVAWRVATNPRSDRPKYTFADQDDTDARRQLYEKALDFIADKYVN